MPATIVFDDPGNNYSAYYDDIIRIMQAAVNAWQSLLVGSANWEIQVNFGASGNTLASITSTTFGLLYRDNSDNRLVYMPGAGYELDTGIDTNGTAFDFRININPELLPDFYFDPDPATYANDVPFDEYDFYTIMLHEIGHALVFIGWADDNYVLDPDIKSLFDDGIELIGGEPFFTGEESVEVYGGPVPLDEDSHGHVSMDLDAAIMAATLAPGVRLFLTELDLALARDTGFETISANLPGNPVSANNPPTGTVTISGLAEVGEVLNVVVALSDADGLGTFSYQWQADGDDIAGATFASYRLTNDEVGKLITVVVSYTDGVNNLESVSSDPTAAVAAGNEAPVGVADTVSTAEDTPLTISLASLLSNDFDPDLSGSLTIIDVESGIGGNVAFQGNNAVLFTPDLDFFGEASFSYTLFDGDDGVTDGVQVTVNVSAVNDAPIAFSDSLEAEEDEFTVIRAADLLANDIDVDDTQLSLASVTAGVGASVVINAGGNVNFTPDPDFNGTATFFYVARDPIGDVSESTLVTVEVAAGNDAPVAEDDFLSADEDTAIEFTATQLLGNDTDIDSLILSLATVESVSGGTAVLNADGNVDFIAAEDFFGTAVFRYRAQDDEGALSGFANVTVEVAAINDAPLALGDQFATDEDVSLFLTAAELLENDSDVDDTQLLLNSVAALNGGSVSLDDGGINFIPDADFFGEAVFTYTIEDPQGTISDPAQVSVSVAPVNDLPSGSVEIVGEAVENSPLQISQSLSDPEGLGAFSYQWYADAEPIDGANADNYTPVESDIGKLLTVELRYTDGEGTLESVTSAPTEPVLDDNIAPTGEVLITGEAIQNGVLSASNTLQDEDGLGTISYQWLAAGEIVGDGDSLILSQAEVGKAIVLVASYTDGRGTFESVSSIATDAVANVNDLPVGEVKITGEAAEYAVLGLNIDVEDADGLGEFSYRWYADGEQLEGETSASLSLGADLIGQTVSVSLHYVDGFGAEESLNSTATAAVVNVNDPPLGTVVITGTATEDQILGVNADISDKDGLGEFSYQWFADGEAIVGADGLSLELGDAQVSRSLSVEVSYVDGFGTEESLVSNFTAAVINVNDEPQGNIEILGLAEQGERLRVDADISDDDGLGEFEYQWFADGIAIPGATTAQYFVQVDNVGQLITVEISYVDGFGTVESFSSALADVIAPLAPQTVSASVIDGPIAGATIFVDWNNNAHHDSAENTGLTTDSSGQFSGTVLGRGDLIAVGGVNTDTGLVNLVDWKAPLGATVISPLSTVIVELIRSADVDAVLAEALVGNAFGLSDSVDLLHFDPYTSVDSVTALAVQKINAMLSLAMTLADQEDISANLATLIAFDGKSVDFTDIADVVAIASGSGVVSEIYSGSRSIDAANSLEELAAVLAESILDELDTDIQAPRIVSATPTGNAEGVATDTTIQFNFDEAVYLAEATIILRNQNGDIVEVFDNDSVNVLFQTLTLTPSERLLPNRFYSVEIAPGTVQDGRGNPFAGLEDWGFFTVRTVDNTPVHGSVVVDGSAMVTQTLSAITDLFDVEGLGELNFQWFRNNVAIDNAIESTYTVQIADIDSSISVEVSAYDRLGSLEILRSPGTANVSEFFNMFIGSADADAIIGSDQNDRIEALAGNDTIASGLGDDLVNGGPGNDTLELNFLANAHSVSVADDGSLLVEYFDNSVVADSIEFLSFGDDWQTRLPVEQAVNGDSIAQLTQLIDVFRVFFDRIPDTEELEFWQQTLLTGVDSVYDLAASMAQDVTENSLFSDYSEAHLFVEEVYQRAFSRSPDDGGLNYWSEQLQMLSGDDIGELGKLAAQMILSAYSSSSGDIDRTVLSARHEIAMAYLNGLYANPALEYDSAVNDLVHKQDGSDEALQEALATLEELIGELFTSTEAPALIEQATGEPTLQLLGITENPDQGFLLD